MPKKSKKTESKVTTAGVSMASLIKLHPLLTEQSVRRQVLNQATFRVTRSASKYQVAQAVREVYQITPIKVRTSVTKPKERRRGATVGQTTQWKKAYVTVPDITALNLVP